MPNLLARVSGASPTWLRRGALALTLAAVPLHVGASQPLTVVLDGGPGSVISTPAGIDCAPDCGEQFADGTTVTLTATAPPGYALERWEEDCTGHRQCRLAMTGPKTVRAVFAPTLFFEEAELSGVHAGHLAWGDYDADGDLDLAVAGYAGAQVQLYRNDSSALTPSGIDLGATGDIVAWGDYDNDGDVDLLVGGGGPTRLYRNDHSTFVQVATSLPALGLGSQAAWGDYDNDGDLDLALLGSTLDQTTRLFRNDGGIFVDTGAALGLSYLGDLAWADFDNDGDLDLAQAGAGNGRVFRNAGGLLVDSGISLPTGYAGSVAWADYDADGDLDLAFTGGTARPLSAKVFRNEGGTLVDSGIAMEGIYWGTAQWGDANADGNVDLLVDGVSLTAANERLAIAKLYMNDQGLLAETFTGLPELYEAHAAWGDYDNDGFLDLVLLGGFPARDLEVYVGLFRNLGGLPNSVPTAPSGPRATATGSTVALSWYAASDAETPTASLSYNVRVGTTPGGSQVVPAMADAATGFRYVVQSGNAGLRTSHTIHGLAPGIYSWGVQAIDASFAGSPFAEGAFAVGPSLTVGRRGTGSGSVVSNPSGIDCGGTCLALFAPDASVQLTAQPDAGSRFDGWTGACTGTTPTCLVSVNDALVLTAHFSLLPSVTISNAGRVEGDAGTATIDFTVTVD